MPKLWLYFVALILPFIFRLLLLNAGLTDWLWYHHYEGAYTMLSALAAQPLFLQLIGSWPLPVFIVTVWCYWQMEDDECIPSQFLMLPFVYLPFSILGGWIMNSEVNFADLLIHPLIILPAGYIYIFIWALFIWVLDKLRLVL